MTPPTLRSAAWIRDWLTFHGEFFTAPAKLDYLLSELDHGCPTVPFSAALASEPKEEPKVERKLIGGRGPERNVLPEVVYQRMLKYGSDWSFYAERPVPVRSKAEELSDELNRTAEEMERRNYPVYAMRCRNAAKTIKEQDAELRRKVRA